MPFNFTQWWESLPPTTHKTLGLAKAKYIWEEAQKNTLATIEEAVKAQVAYEAGYKDGQNQWSIQMGGYTLQPGQNGMIWITNPHGEGGDCYPHELAETIHKFFQGKF